MEIFLAGVMIHVRPHLIGLKHLPSRAGLKTREEGQQTGVS